MVVVELGERRLHLPRGERAIELVVGCPLGRVAGRSPAADGRRARARSRSPRCGRWRTARCAARHGRGRRTPRPARRGGTPPAPRPPPGWRPRATAGRSGRARRRGRRRRRGARRRATRLPDARSLLDREGGRHGGVDLAVERVRAGLHRERCPGRRSRRSPPRGRTTRPRRRSRCGTGRRRSAGRSPRRERRSRRSARSRRRRSCRRPPRRRCLRRWWRRSRRPPVEPPSVVVVPASPVAVGSSSSPHPASPSDEHDGHQRGEERTGRRARGHAGGYGQPLAPSSRDARGRAVGLQRDEVDRPPSARPPAPRRRRHVRRSTWRGSGRRRSPAAGASPRGGWSRPTRR